VILLAVRAVGTTIATPDPIIGRRLFADGIARLVFLDEAGHQYVIDLDGHTRSYDDWLHGDGADMPLVTTAND
jgi:hypothetical protein